MPSSDNDQISIDDLFAAVGSPSASNPPKRTYSKPSGTAKDTTEVDLLVALGIMERPPAPAQQPEPAPAEQQASEAVSPGGAMVQNQTSNQFPQNGIAQQWAQELKGGAPMGQQPVVQQPHAQPQTFQPLGAQPQQAGVPLPNAAQSAIQPFNATQAQATQQSQQVTQALPDQQAQPIQQPLQMQGNAVQQQGFVGQPLQPGQPMQPMQPGQPMQPMQQMQPGQQIQPVAQAQWQAMQVSQAGRITTLEPGKELPSEAQVITALEPGATQADASTQEATQSTETQSSQTSDSATTVTEECVPTQDDSSVAESAVQTAEQASEASSDAVLQADGLAAVEQPTADQASAQSTQAEQATQTPAGTPLQPGVQQVQQTAAPQTMQPGIQPGVQSAMPQPGMQPAYPLQQQGASAYPGQPSPVQSSQQGAQPQPQQQLTPQQAGAFAPTVPVRPVNSAAPVPPGIPQQSMPVYTQPVPAQEIEQVGASSKLAHVIGAILILMALGCVAVAVCLLLGVVDLSSFNPNSSVITSNLSSQAAPSATDEELNNAENSVDNTSQMYYQYVIRGADGGTHEAVEIANFDADGKLDYSQLEISVDSEEDASKLLDQLRQDFGDALVESNTDKEGRLTCTIKLQRDDLDKNSYTELLASNAQEFKIISQ